MLFMKFSGLLRIFLHSTMKKAAVISCEESGCAEPEIFQIFYNIVLHLFSTNNKHNKNR